MESFFFFFGRYGKFKSSLLRDYGPLEVVHLKQLLLSFFCKFENEKYHSSSMFFFARNYHSSSKFQRNINKSYANLKDNIHKFNGSS